MTLQFASFSNQRPWLTSTILGLGGVGTWYSHGIVTLCASHRMPADKMDIFGATRLLKIIRGHRNVLALIDNRGSREKKKKKKTRIIPSESAINLPLIPSIPN